MTIFGLKLIGRVAGIEAASRKVVVGAGVVLRMWVADQREHGR
jgi:hypothetical protein